MPTMQRRIAIAAAAAVALVLTAGGVAVAAGIGVLGSSGGEADPVGQLSVAGIADLVPAPSTVPQVVVVDEWVSVPGAPSSSAAAPSPTSGSSQGMAGPSAQPNGPDIGSSIAGSVAGSLDPVPVDAPTSTTLVRVDDDGDDDGYDDDDDDDDDYDDDEYEDDEYEDDDDD